MVATKGKTERGYDKQKHNHAKIWEKRNERPLVGDVYIRSRNGAPSRKGCEANGQTTQKAGKKYVYPPPPKKRANKKRLNQMLRIFLIHNTLYIHFTD